MAAPRGSLPDAFWARRAAAYSSRGACGSSMPCRAVAVRCAIASPSAAGGCSAPARHWWTRSSSRAGTPRGLGALAALCVLIVDPWAIMSVGAWLSVSAVAAVIWAGRATERMPKLVRVLAPASAATVLSAPITAYAFGTVAPVGILANLVAIPLAGLAVPGLMVALLMSSGWLAAGAGLCLALLDLVAKGAAALPGGHFIMIAGPRAGDHDE